MPNSAPPRRRNAERTRANILSAAKQAFAETGYSQAGIRDIATLAGVSSPMLLRYFGSKAGLFEAALIDALRVEGIFDQQRDAFGAQLTALLMTPDLDVKLPAMIALSTGDADAREVTSRVTREHALEPLAQWLGPPHASARAAQIMMLATGFVLYTRLVPLQAAPEAIAPSMADWLAQTLQQVVDQSGDATD